MTSKILKCQNCNKYTLKEKCMECNVKTLSQKPPRFGTEDKYVKYRIKYKKRVGLLK